MIQIKKIVFIATSLTVFSLSVSSQIYSTLQVSAYSTESSFGAGPHFSFGYHSNNFGIGPGIGIMLMGTEKPYIPIYASVLYSGGANKFSPMGNVQFGKGLYKGSGEFIGKEQLVEATFYGNVQAGVAVKFKGSKAHLFGGVGFMGFKPDVTVSFFSLGLGFFTTN